MQAIIENGGIKIEGIRQLGDTLVLFNAILDAIWESEDSDDLNIKITGVFYKSRKFVLNNPFKLGFSSEGAEIWQEGKTDRLIFIPCETDIEI